MTGPLDGLRILDLTRLLPGGYATLLMADLGADVVKVEEPGKGDYIRWSPPIVGDHSAAHIALNRNKRSITLNLRSDEGRSLFLDLVARFDIVIESFRPGVMDRLGIGWSVLHRADPRLIYCAISGYGQDGPRAVEAGHDVNYISRAGVQSIIGMKDEGPVIPGVQIGDLAGGGMAAIISVLAALHRRAATGEGDFCDVSMMDGAFSWLSIHGAAFVATGEVPRYEEQPLSGGYPCYRIYPAADGFLSVGALEPQFWSRFCAAIDRPDLTDDAFSLGDRAAHVIAELESLFSTRTRAGWMELFEGQDVCVAPVNDFAEAFADQQLQHRGMIVETDIPGTGTWRSVGNPIRLLGAPGMVDRLPPPGLGEHTAEILGELGVSEVDVAELRAKGAV